MKDIIFPITYKSDPKGLTDAEKDLQALQKSIFKMGQVAIASFAVATVAVAAFSVEALKSAAALEQSSGAIEAVFKDASAVVESFSEDAATNFGLSASSYQNLAAVIGNSLKTMGLSTTDLAGKTNDLIGLGADLAATFGGTTADAVAALTSGLRGEYDSLERLIPGITAATVSTKALEMTGKTNADQLVDSEKKAAFLALAFQNSAEAQGQFARENDTASGSMQIFQAKVEDLQAAMGEKLLPAFGKLVEKFTEVIDTKGPQIEQAFTVVGNAVMFLVDALIAVGAFFDSHPGMFEAVAIALTSVGVALGIATAAMWAFNIAAYANPIVLVVGLIVVAIGAVIAAIVMLAMNWDTVVTNMQNAWASMSYAIGSVWTGMINGIIDGINTVLNLINGVLGSKLQVAKVQFNGLGAGKKDKQGRSLYVPGQATGGETTRAGLSWVGERGPELLNLPTGAQVIPLSKIGNGGGGGATYNISVNAGMGADGAALGEQIVTAIRKYERTSGAVFAKA